MNASQQNTYSDRHLHLLLSAPFTTYQGISSSPIPTPPKQFGSLERFLDYVTKNFIPLFQSLETVQRVVRAAFQSLLDSNITYAEASVPLGAPLRAGVPWSEYAQLLRKEQQAVADRLTVRLEIGHAREIPGDWLPHLKAAITTGIFEGVDLYGNELHGDIRELEWYFATARAQGLYVKLHTGEICGAARMRYELDRVRPNAVQHGIAAVQDADLLKHLAEMGIPLHVCPSSNVAAGTAKSIAEHPIAALHRNRVKVTVGSDDQAIFGVTVRDEFARLLSAGTLDSAELDQIRLNGVQR